MFKSSFTSEQKIRVCTEYLSCKKSAVQLAAELNMGKNGNIRIREWAAKYLAYGSEAFDYSGKNAVYSKEFKERVVKEYLTGFSSLNGLCVKYKIRSKTQLGNWLMKYNNHIELKDYDPKPEVYMVDTLKTTYEERIEIVKDCLAHDRNIKGVAAKYGCRYAQLYQWVRKYEANGEEALADKRGKRKQEDEISELEKAERKIVQLEREKEEYRMKYELLKKAEERERW